MNDSKLWVLIAAALITARIGFAQEPAAAKVSLEALINRAMTRSQSIKASRLRIEEKQFAAQQAKAWRNPELILVGGRKEAKSEDPAEGTKSGLLYEASIAQPFFFPGKQKLRGEIGNLEAEAAQLKANEAELSLIHEVVRLSYAFDITRRLNIQAQTRHRRLELIQSYLAGHAFASPQQRAERMIVERRLNNLIAASLTFNAALKSTHEKLGLLVGWESESSAQTLQIAVPWLTGDVRLEPRVSDPAITERNPTLAAQRVLVSAAQKENRLAKWENFPDVTVFGSYAQEKAGDTERFLKGGLSFELPIFNRNRGSIRSTALKIDAENAILRFNEQQIQSQLAQLHAEYDSARQIAQLYPEALFSELEKQIKEAEREFRKGRLTLLTFLELDSEIGETYEHSLQAQADLLDKLQAISYLSGDRDVVSRLSEY